MGGLHIFKFGMWIDKGNGSENVATICHVKGNIGHLIFRTNLGYLITFLSLRHLLLVVKGWDVQSVNRNQGLQVL